MKISKLILVWTITLLLLSSCTISKNGPQSSDSQTSSFVTEKHEKKELFNESTEGTNTITIDGVVYRNKFQGDLILRNPMYGKEPALVDNTGRYFRLEGIDYDLIYDVTSEQIGHSESVYCRDEQWEELKKYYSDSNNFTYQCIIKTNGVSSETVHVDKMDIVKLNELLAFCEENAYDPNAFAGTNNTKAVSTSSLGDKAYRFKMSSNDGLFSVDAKSFSILDNALVYRYYEVMPEDKTLIIDVPKELSDYFVSIITSLTLNE